MANNRDDTIDKKTCRKIRYNKTRDATKAWHKVPYKIDKPRYKPENKLVTMDTLYKLPDED